MAGLVELAGRLGLRVPDEDASLAIRRLRDLLTTWESPALLVFDNVTDVDTVDPLLPVSGRVQVVITSTLRAAEQLGTPLFVDVFSPDMSIQYLTKATQVRDRVGAQRLAKELGGHPLGLAQAASRIRNIDRDYGTYLERYHKLSLRHVLKRRPGDPYPRCAAASIALALERLEPSGGGVLSDVLETLAVLSPDGLSRSYLYRYFDRVLADESLATLHEASIVQFAGSVDHDAVVMHRLTQRVVRELCEDAGTLSEVLHRAADRLRTGTLEDDLHARTSDYQEEAVRHIDALWANCRDAHRASPVCGALCLAVLDLRAWAVGYLVVSEALNRAIPLARSVYADSARLLGSGDRRTAAAGSALGEAFMRSGLITEAIALLESTLSDQYGTCGTDDPEYLSTANRLARAYRHAGELTRSIDLHERTLQDRRRVLGDTHSDTLASAINLGYVYASVGRFDEAIALHERALVDCRSFLGVRHRHTLSAMNDLARSYSMAGRPFEAVRILEPIVSELRLVLGHAHPRTLTAARSLANAYASADRMSEAVALFEETLTRCLRTFPEEHPLTRNVRVELESLREMG
jgi:tetratricopeptide (TPR) repeat protein